MQTQSAPGGPRRSAFAAAFLSFLFPGLGHAYLGRWLRALGWAALPILSVALLGGLLSNHATRVALASEVLDPTMVLALLAIIVADLLYRLASMLDAWRLARVPGADDVAARRLGSAVGLLAVIAVLFVSHAAIAMPVYGWYQYLNGGFGGDDLDEQLPEDVLPSGLVAPSFETLAPGETATPTPEPTPTPTQGPEWNGGPLNILLIGADAGRAGYSGYLTDTMITVMIDPVSKQLAMVSLPRDTAYVPLPRGWPAYRAYGGAFPYKINSLYTYARGLPDLFPVGDNRTRGYDALKAVLGELYGIKIDYYVAVDLNSFRDVVDGPALRGLIIDVQNPVYDASYPSDDGRGKIKLYIPPGIQYMDGRKSLSYARARHATSDFDRAARQQRVVTSAREQFDLPSLLTPGRLTDLLRLVKRSVRTDIPPKKLPQMVQLAEEIDLDGRISLVLSGSRYQRTCYLDPPPCPQNTSWQLVPNVDKMRRDVSRVFKEDRATRERRERIQAEEAVVHVLNGTAGSNLKTMRIAEYLAEQGMDAQVPPINNGAAETDDYTDAVITVYDGVQDDLPATIGALERALRVTATTADDPEQEADIVVIVGTRTPALRPEG
jgi:LCP family protein required for cell wall assembly